MLRYFLQRFLMTLPALWLVLTLVFLMIHIVPGDPVEQMLGEGAAPGELAQLRHSLGLDLSLPAQYGHYLSQLARGDLGHSLKFQAPVRRIIFERYPATLQLAFMALLVCAAIAVPAGVLAAHRRGTGADRAVGVFTLFGLAIPNFALGPLLPRVCPPAPFCFVTHFATRLFRLLLFLACSSVLYWRARLSRKRFSLGRGSGA
jgi:ABC-type dipeptide/oligopeptide/nickel transport system permease component